MADQAPELLSQQGARLRQIYDSMWSEAAAALATDTMGADPTPSDDSMRWGVSAVLRPAGHVATRLHQVSQEMVVFTGKYHAAYDRSSIHTTLRSLEAYRAQVPPEDALVQRYAAIVSEIIAEMPPIELVYQGLTIMGVGVVAQGWPVGETLKSLRGALYERLAAAELIQGPEHDGGLIRETAHASLIVFGGPLNHAGLLSEYVGNHRDTYYGRATVNSVDLVRYYKTKTMIRVEQLASIPFGG